MTKHFFDFYYSKYYPNQSKEELWRFINILENYNIKIVLEIGVAEGGSGRFWQYFCEKNKGFYIGIDIYIQAKFLDNCKNVILIEGKSQDNNTIEQVKNILKQKQYIDFIFIDGNHIEQDVYMDIINYYPFLASQGIMGLHDYRNVEVFKAIQQAKNDKIFKYEKEDTILGSDRIDMGIYYLINQKRGKLK